jgi:hypothetical protein
MYSTLLFFLSFCMDFGISETGIARGSPPGTTTEVLRFGVPFAEIRVVSVRHLEHDRRDTTARCQDEQERRMALEALVGGKYFDLHLDSMLAPGSLSLTVVHLSQMFLTGTVT